MATATLDALELELAELVEVLAEAAESGDAQAQPLIQAGLNVKNSNDVLL